MQMMIKTEFKIHLGSVHVIMEWKKLVQSILKGLIKLYIKNLYVPYQNDKVSTLS